MNLPTKPTKASPVLELIQSKYPEYHPVLAIAKLAIESADEKIQLDCHKALIKFVVPELKSIEVVSEHTERQFVRVSMFEENIVEAEIIENTPISENGAHE